MATDPSRARSRDRRDQQRITALGSRIRSERHATDLSLQVLADRSDVSRSMLSAIERGDKAPTVLVLDRIANALGVSVSRLLDEERESGIVFLPSREQRVLEEPAGWRRVIVSPVVPGVEMEIGRLEFQPYTDAGVFGAHQRGWTEYVVVERGTLELTLDRDDRYLLHEGDAIYYESDRDHAFRNPGAEIMIGYIIMAGGG